MYENTHEPTTRRCKYRVLAIQFDFWKINLVYSVYAACVFIAHFRPVKFSKTIFHKMAKPLAS